MGWANMETTFTHPDGREFSAELGRISRAHLGVEPDHGMLTVALDFEFPGSGQGLGHICIGKKWSEYNPNIEEGTEDFGPGTRTSDGEHVHKMYASGAQFLVQLMSVVGGSWEDLVGQEAWVLREGGRWGGMIKGIASKSKSQRFLITEDFFEEMKKLDD